jgi:hypothetical protein
MSWYWLGLAAIAAGILLTVLWRYMHGMGRAVQHERAREMFRLQRERLEAKFLDAAAATGKPRGLIWMDCDFEPQIELVRDLQNKQLLGLVPVTIKFEAKAGGPMEGVEAVGNLRYATAVFVFERGHWVTQGRALFNMHPGEAINHFAGQFERVR